MKPQLRWQLDKTHNHASVPNFWNGHGFRDGRGRYMTDREFSGVWLPFTVHPHQLRHACGYKLANDGHDMRSLAHYLGHRNLQLTARYTALAPDQFARFWQD